MQRERSQSVSLCKRMEHVSDGKQRNSKNGAHQIKVMASAVIEPPMHPGEDVDCFTDMRENDYEQTSCSEQLQESAYRLDSVEKDC
jgi:hypothetical protein